MSKKKTNTAEKGKNSLELMQEISQGALDQLAYAQTAEGQREAKELVEELKNEGKSAWAKPGHRNQ